ncbi:hypothetical protein DR871_001155 [Flavobacterium petrolei]|jgi:hypothetical protein|uniref:ApeA N-terminal domain-containing protein n=1 Tax=Flavobacterium petrolei TaxID=2259594 RepID=A0A482TKA2_9FLAO|nr:hypothetical protein [Flavobacterium petrolei]RYJ52691.1 hypothetical protein DR871_001155 [Flavobacterium petrolei]
MSLVYTIKSGYLECQEEKLNIPFALIFLENGIYSLEILLPSNDFYNKYKFNYYYKLYGITEKNYFIECSGLQLTSYDSGTNKVIFRCDNYIKLTKNDENEPEIEDKKTREQIFFVELENFKTQFGNFTHINRSNNLEDYNTFFTSPIPDHTETVWITDDLENNGNYFKFKIIQKPNSENILIDFRSNEGYCKLYYDNYLKIKKDLISILSFINGGIVIVRSELTGDYYSQSNNGFDSHKKINYSREIIKDYSHNDYIGINSHHSQSDSIFREIFFNCFRNFQKLNKLLDFDSLIISLNIASQSKGLDERYFILITALERITKKYSTLNIDDNSFLIDNEIFENEIKVNLIEALEKVKVINPNSWGIMKSVVSNLNNKNNGTKKSLYTFLNYAKIPINENVLNLIGAERNDAVHEGKIGKTLEDSYENYLKLDNILRDVILNSIEYFSYRNRKYVYATKEEFIEANPKPTNYNFPPAVIMP